MPALVGCGPRGSSLQAGGRAGSRQVRGLQPRVRGSPDTLWQQDTVQGACLDDDVLVEKDFVPEKSQLELFFEVFQILLERSGSNEQAGWPGNKELEGM